MITITRLDFPRTLDVLLDLSEQHLAGADGKERKGIEDIIFCLNKATECIRLYGLADRLSAPVKSAPSADAPGAPAEQPPAAILTKQQAAILAYLRANPGCTTVETCAALGCAPGGLAQQISLIRKTSLAIRVQRSAQRGGPGRYYLED